VGVRVAQCAEPLLEMGLVRIRVAVEAEDVYLGRPGAAGLLPGDGRPVGILVGVEEDVGAVVLVVAATQM